MKDIFKSAGYVLMLIVAYMAFQVVFTCIASILFALYGISVGELSADAVKSIFAPELHGNWSVWSMAIGLMLSSLAMLLFIHCIKGYRLSLNIFRSISGEPLLMSTMLVFTSMFAMNIFVQWFNLEDNLSNELDGLAHNVIGVITITLLAPLLEEVLFRGAIQGYLMRRYKPWIAILCAALVFGVFHMNPVQIVYATMIGIVFGWIYYRTGSLLSVIVGHVLNNGLATFMLLMFGKEGEALPVGEIVPPSVELASEIITFSFFALLSLYFAFRLNRVQPPVTEPWDDL